MKVTIRPRQKKNKYSLLSSSTTGEKAFWEELRDSALHTKPERVRVPKIRSSEPVATIEESSFSESVVPVESRTNSIAKQATVITESDLPVIQNPVEKYLEPSQSITTIHPTLLSVQHDLVHCKNPMDVLILTDCGGEKLDVINLATGLHRIARLSQRKSNVTPLEMIKADRRFLALVSSIGDRVPDMGIVAMSNVLWSLVKLGEYSETVWAKELVDRLAPVMMECPSDLLSSNLYAAAELSKTSAKSAQPTVLVDSIVSAILNRGIDAIDTRNLISISTSLARLGRLERPIMAALADRVIGQIDTIAIDELTSVLWAFTSLKVVDKTLYSKVQSSLEKRAIRDCSKRNLVDLVWALAKGRPSTADESLGELFRFTIAPLIRTHMMDLTVRELSTVLWSFASAEVVDADFYSDLAHALIPKVSEMNAHDVSSIVWGLGSVYYSHSDLFRHLKHQAYVLRNEFTPLQLSRVVYGLGAAGVKDSKTMEGLIDSCKKRMHLLYTQNIVEILMGLTSVGLVDQLGHPFLEALTSQIQRVSGRDAVQILKSIGHLENTHVYAELVSQLGDIVKTRFNCSGRWIPNGYDLCDLVESMGRLDLSDPDMVETVLLHLSTVYKSPSFTPDLWLRFLSATSSSFKPGSVHMRTLKKLLLLKEKGIQVAASKLTEQLVLHARGGQLSIPGAVEILSMYAHIGFQDDSVLSLAQLIEESITYSGLPKPPPLDTRIELCSSLAQLQILPEFAFAQAAEATEAVLAGTEVSEDCIVDLLWARLALADDPANIPAELVRRLGEVFEAGEWIPKNMYRLKQVALSMRGIGEASNSKFTDQVLSVRPVVPHIERKKDGRVKKITHSIDKYDSLVSFALGELGIKHTQMSRPMKEMPYTVSAALAGTRPVCIDVLGPEAVVAPRVDKWSGESVLKKLHLVNNGWTVVNVTMRQVQNAQESNSLKPFVADLIAPYNEKGKERVSFASSRIPASSAKVVNSAIEDLFGRK